MANNSQKLAAAAANITIEDLGGEKVRVHALAKALGVTSAEFVQVLSEQGIGGKRAASTLPRSQVEEVLGALGAAGSGAALKKTAAKKAPAKKAVAKKEPAKKAPAKKVASQKPAVKKTVDKEAPAKNAAATETVKKAPTKNTAKKAVKKAAAKATPVADEATTATVTPNKATAKKATLNKATAKKTVAKKASATKTTAGRSTSKNTTATPPAIPTVTSQEQLGPPRSLAPETATERASEVAPKAALEVTAEVATVSGKKTATASSRPPRRGRKAAITRTTAAPNGVDNVASASSLASSAVGADRSEDTVDALIDRIAESVDVEASAPKVRRRVVRRVGSRSINAERNVHTGSAHSSASSSPHADVPEVREASDNAAHPTTGAEAVEGLSPEQPSQRSRRRGRRGRGRGRGEPDTQQGTEQSNAPSPLATGSTSGVDSVRDAIAIDDLPVLTESPELVDEPVRLKGSTRLESKRRWRQEQGNDRRKVVSKAEFLARRENVDRAIIVRDSLRSDHPGTTTQVGITEDGMLVEHFVTSETQSSIIGNIYLGRVQNVLASMEAAFIDIGTGRNAVLYAGEVDWRSAHLHTRVRRIESALKPGDQILVQVIKDPLGHKGARLTNRISFAGRYLVYVPGGRTQGISRKLPEAERKRLKDILQRVVPEDGGTIIRTAAEGVSEELISEDVNRLHARWEDIQIREQKARARKGAHPMTMFEEPNMLVKVIRDIFNEDFTELVVDGEKSWSVVRDYVHRMAPDLESRVVRYHPEDHDGEDVFANRQLDEQLAKALSRKVWLPSGGYLIIDPTEAMTVIDVNTGSFVGSGGNLEETVTRNNLEAAEEIVRQMRLRDLGGMIVVDFIDMVLPENRDLVLRRLSEYLGRDRTRHKVSEVTSLGLVQMTRKRLGTGLLETFSTTCPTCDGRGVIVHADPVEHDPEEENHHRSAGNNERRDHGHRAQRQQSRGQQETRQRHERDRSQDRSPDRSQEPEDLPTEKFEDQGRGRPGAATNHESAEVAAPVANRRSRRRVVRRVDPPAIDASGVTADDVAAIAAQAVSHAGAEDPDEPSGADYAPAEQLGSRAATSSRSRAVTSSSSIAGGKDSAPRSIADVDRRGRRRVRRVTSPSVEKQAPQSQVSETESYAEAKAEFDSSPRRRRRTRGRSRSDIAPRRESFTGESRAAVEPAVSEVPPSRRGRRRVVRSSQ